jgi:hypothetical protein
VSHYSARDLNRLAEAELERNRAEVIAEAEHMIATAPEFERWRIGAKLESNAQETKPQKSMTSMVQISGAK